MSAGPPRDVAEQSARSKIGDDGIAYQLVRVVGGIWIRETNDSSEFW